MEVIVADNAGFCFGVEHRELDLNQFASGVVERAATHHSGAAGRHFGAQRRWDRTDEAKTLRRKLDDVKTEVAEHLVVPLAGRKWPALYIAHHDLPCKRCFP